MPVANWSFISANHARQHGRKTFVYNGFPVDDYRLSTAKGDRLLFLAGMLIMVWNTWQTVRRGRAVDALVQVPVAAHA